MTGTSAGDSAILGSLGSAQGKGIVRMEDCLDADTDEVWSALTDPRRLPGWLGTVEGDLRLGGRFHAHYLASGWEGTGRVSACEPPRHLEVVTKHAGTQEEHVIEVMLTSEGSQTVLVLEERGMPLNLLAAYGAGVQVHVEDLAARLPGRERCDADARWEELQPAYEALAAKVG
ncbi:MAG TPA: SRPBCC domain-containing protein [Chloroflexota bacterium]|nr:SRPBCC domain-containing protein [Chloroflexota bacterium]